MTRRIAIARYTLGRWLVHLGIWIMPQGRTRAELTERLWAWRMQVDATLAAEKWGG